MYAAKYVAEPTNISCSPLKHKIAIARWSIKRIVKENSGVQKGFIAQEVEKVFPEWVKDGEDGYKTINTSEFTPVLVEAIKELKNEKDKEISELKSELLLKDNEIAELRKEVESLKSIKTEIEQIKEKIGALC